MKIVVDILLAVEKLNSILHETVLMSTKFIKCKPPIIKRRFSDSCTELKDTVKSYLSLVNKYPTSDLYRQEYYSFLSRYRRRCKSEERKYKKIKFVMINILI
jgi:hypothetical protein